MNPQLYAKTLKKESAHKLCKWISYPDMARVRAFDIAKDVTSLVQHQSSSDMLDHLVRRLAELGETPGNILAYRNMINVLKNPFETIHSEYLLLKYFENEKLYIPPEEIVIGKEYVFETRTEEDIEDPDNISFQFIPLRKVLKQFFEIPGILKSTRSYVEKLKATRDSSPFIKNVVQCEAWKQKEALFDDSLRLSLSLYQDEYETNNPLGSHKGIGKLGAVYCFPSCLPLALQSKVENIFLLTLFRANDLNRVPAHMLFSKAIAELKFLEENGITVDTDEGPLTIFFSVAVLMGDNLAVNFMLGFTTGFSAKYPCRFCKVHGDDINKVFKECDCELRTEESYQQDLMLDNLTKTGIKRQSLLSDLKTNSALGLMALDIAHDINEGTFEYDFGLILYHFIKDSPDIPLTLHELNSRIKKFDYGTNEKRNKPVVITNEKLAAKHSKMSGSEASGLIRNIGLMIGDLIPRGNEHWQLLILLKEIYDILTSPVITTDIIDYLESLITRYLTELQRLFGNCLKVKHHNLLHCATILRRFGSLIFLSTMRCESKHHIAKMTTGVSNSRNNVCKTVAIKSQLQFCYRMMSGEIFEDKLYKCGHFETVKAKNIRNFYLFAPLLPTIELETPVKELRTIEFHGRTIREKVVLMIPAESGPCLYNVVNLLEVDSQDLFIIVINVTDEVMYDSHFSAYELFCNSEITDQSKLECLTSEQLRFAYVSFLTTAKNKKQYIPKRWI